MALLLPQLSARRLTPAVLVVAVWFVVALAVSAAGVFDQPPDTPPVAIGLAAAVPPLVVIGLLVGSARFHGWARDLDLRFLTLLQTWRLAGVAFLALLVVGELPARFAVPAGVGDVIVGLTAPVVAVYVVGGGRWARWGYVGWTLFGIADLVAAVSLGVTTGSGMEPLAVLPLSMIPAFGVPLTLALHAISLATRVPGRAVRNRAGSVADGSRRLSPVGRARPPRHDWYGLVGGNRNHPSPKESAQMMTVVTQVTLKSGCEPEWDAAMRERLAAAGGRRGWVGGQLLIPLDGHNRRAVIGTWESRADWEAWHEDARFVETRRKMDGLQEGRSEMTWYEVVTEARGVRTPSVTSSR